MAIVIAINISEVAVKLLISMIDWEYPENRKIPEATIWDLNNKNHLTALILSFGNGIIIEMRADGDTDEALEILCGIARGVGNYNQTELSFEECKELWLHEEGYDCFTCPSVGPTHVFISPKAKPALFQ